jgi:hypothetical protein
MLMLKVCRLSLYLLDGECIFSIHGSLRRSRQEETETNVIELEFGWRAIGGTAKIVTILRQERTRKGTMLFDHGNGTVQNLKWN